MELTDGCYSGGDSQGLPEFRRRGFSGVARVFIAEGILRGCQGDSQGLPGIAEGILRGCQGFSGVARVYSPPCPWDTHYQFSIKTLLSKIHSMVHRGSAFEPGASGLLYYCASICVCS